MRAKIFNNKCDPRTIRSFPLSLFIPLIFIGCAQNFCAFSTEEEQRLLPGGAVNSHPSDLRRLEEGARSRLESLEAPLSQPVPAIVERDGLLAAPDSEAALVSMKQIILYIDYIEAAAAQENQDDLQEILQRAAALNIQCDQVSELKEKLLACAETAISNQGPLIRYFISVKQQANDLIALVGLYKAQDARRTQEVQSFLAELKRVRDTQRPPSSPPKGIRWYHVVGGSVGVIAISVVSAFIGHRYWT